MPTPAIDRPLTKVTLNLYTDDLLALKRRHGHGGVSVAIRTLVTNYLKAGKLLPRALNPITLEDYCGD